MKQTGSLAGGREKRALSKLARTGHPAGGTLLGVNQDTGKKIIVSDEEINQHCFIVGTTGSGKTTAIMNFAESAVSRNISLVLIDGKGAQDLAGKIKNLAQRYERQFYLFTMHGERWHYNPLARGGITELTDKLINLTEWTEPHYKKMAERYLQLVFRVLALAGKKPDLVEITKYLHPDNLAMLTRNIADDEERGRIFSTLDSFTGPEIGGLAARLAVMTESEIGHLFRDAPGRTIDLASAIEENAAVVFLLDSLSFPEFSRLLGRLVVADMKGVAARQTGRKKKIFTIFDEFSVFASDAVVDLIAKTRAFGFCTLIGTQSLSDLERAGGPAMMEQIIENCNTYIIQRQNSAVNAEKMANIIGTEDSQEITYQTQQGILFRRETGMGSVKETKKYITHPDQIKRLKTGEAILVRKTDKFGVERMKVRQPMV